MISGKEEMTEDNLSGKANAIRTLRNAQLALMFPNGPLMLAQVQQFPCQMCQSCTYIHTLRLTQI